jgi:hypothetical protein
MENKGYIKYGRKYRKNGNEMYPYRRDAEVKDKRNKLTNKQINKEETSLYSGTLDCE